MKIREGEWWRKRDEDKGGRVGRKRDEDKGGRVEEEER